MRILFVHNNFPAQFRNLADDLRQEGRHELVAIGAENAADVPGIKVIRYATPDLNAPEIHAFARRFDAESRRAEQVLYAATTLIDGGFEPDLIFAHCGWGESLPLRALFPQARIAIYCEYFYRREGQDVAFDSIDGRMGVDGLTQVHAFNASTLLAMTDADILISPTQWQRSTYPKDFQSRIQVAHEGVDIEIARPDPLAWFELPGGRRLTREDEIVTYLSRSLEPMRGFHVFLRAAIEILAARPRAQIVIVGATKPSYGPLAPDGSDWKTHLLRELLPALDLSRVHFLEPQPYGDFLSLLQISSAHVYLTYPFVLSWSLIEAMAVGAPLVASDTEPVREVLEHGRNALLTPFHDPRTLAETVARTLADPAQGALRARQARADAAAFFDRRTCVASLREILGLKRAESAAA